MSRRRAPPTRKQMQQRRDSWANAAEFGGHGFTREACLRVVRELDQELARYDEQHPTVRQRDDDLT